KTPIIRPVFILGHLRSGITYLQTLMAAHPSFAAINMFDALFPEHFVLTEAWLKPILQTISRRVNYHNPFHRRLLDWDEVQEEDLAFNSMAAQESAYWGRVLGRPEQLKKIDPKKRIYTHFRLVQKLQKHNPGKRLVLKSPPNLLFLPEIMKTYPDARFVFIHRNPLEIYHSMQKLWRATFEDFALVKMTEEEVHKAIIEDYIELMEAYETFRRTVPAQKLLEVNYHQLKASEAEEMAKIWTFLGESPTPFPVRSTSYTPQNYETREELKAELTEKWGKYIWYEPV
ncbi:MAG: sulfotransferase, partial [Bacteroidetes bacterium]|nr:sulfotransferase [Bacteroidota bacterium]